MAQGCWSVGSVCATSYSWTTGPHWGAMESPQTAAGTRDPATPMVAVPAENGSTNLAGVRDGLGFLTWVESFNDTTTEAGQIKALASFAKFKYPIDTTVLQLRK